MAERVASTLPESSHLLYLYLVRATWEEVRPDSLQIGLPIGAKLVVAPNKIDQHHDKQARDLDCVVENTLPETYEPVHKPGLSLKLVESDKHILWQ